MTAEEQVRLQLDRILNSPQLVAAERRTRLLRFLVEQSLHGKAGDLKETVIAREVFDRSSDHDPKIDSVVRVEMGRLRSRLIEYYADGGKHDAVRIEIPNGRYVPLITFAGGNEFVAADDPKRSAEQRRPRRLTVTAALLVCTGLGVLAASGLWLYRYGESAVPPSIAVLPFLNLTGNPDNDFLGDSITDELTGTFAEVGTLRVVARTSAFVFKGKNTDIGEIGRALRASAILEGSVSRKAGQLSIVAQLIQTKNGYHLWSKSYTFDPDELQKTEAQIVSAAAHALRPDQPEFATGATRLMSTRSSEAHDLYLRARYTFGRGTLDSTQTSLQLAQQAMAKDPNYPLPYFQAAIAEYTLAQYGAEPQKTARENARKNLEDAIRLDPGFGDAHASHALALYDGDHDWPKAEAEFKLAVRLGSVQGMSLYGWALTTRGRFADADEQLQSAIDRDPLSAGPRMNRHVALLFEGKRPQARGELTRVLELNPENVHALVQLAYIDAEDHRTDAARGNLERIRKINPALPAVPFLEALIEIQTGRAAEARRILADFEGPKYPGRSYFHAAILHALLDEPDGMFDNLRYAMEHDESAVLYLKVHPMFQRYGKDPRFAELAARLGL